MEFEALVPVDTRLRARISQRSNLKYVQMVLEHFDERQRHDFRESSLGFLTEISDIQFSAQLIQQLVFRGIRTDKEHELWFNVQRHYCRFGLQEYAVVTSMCCGVPPDDERFHRVLEKTRLKDKYFRSLDKVSCAQIEKTLVRSSTPRADRYKLGLALIVERVFNAPDNNVGIECATLSIVDDLDVFFAYPWGRVGYSRLIKGFQGRYASKLRYAKRKREKEISYTVHGFPIAMQIWAFEAIPEIGQRFGQRLGERSPRILSWMATKQSQHRTYNAFFKKVQLHVFATLCPTELERNQRYMATLMPFDDNVVPVLDAIANTVVEAQFDIVADVGGGDGHDSSKNEDDGDDGSGGSDEIASGTGDRAVQSTEENDDSSSDNVREDGEGESHADRAQGGMTGVQMGRGLTRPDVDDLLLDQRVLFEMRLRTVKLEILEHVTAEHARLRDFISTVVAPAISTASAVPTDMRNDVHAHSPQPYGGHEDEFGVNMD